MDGVEWNVRLSQVTSPDILEKFQATFDFLSRITADEAPPIAATLTEAERRILLALHFTLRGTQGNWTSLDASMAELWAQPAVLSELRELFAVLEDQSSHLTYPVAGGLPRARVGESRGVWDSVPLSVHASYSLTRS